MTCLLQLQYKSTRHQQSTPALQLLVQQPNNMPTQQLLQAVNGPSGVQQSSSLQSSSQQSHLCLLQRVKASALHVEV
jgi:hypothetical protein